MIRDLKNGTKYESDLNTRMSEYNSSEANSIMSAHESNNDNESETRIFTQEEVDEQIKNYIDPVTSQLEHLSRLIQGMSTAHRPNLSPRECTTTSSSAAGSSPETATKQVKKAISFLFLDFQAHVFPIFTSFSPRGLQIFLRMIFLNFLIRFAYCNE